MKSFKEFSESTEEKKYTWITFGQDHVHRVNNITFDKDVVAQIPCNSSSEGRDKAFKLFGAVWAFQYETLPNMSYFPRGVIEIDV